MYRWFRSSASASQPGRDKPHLRGHARSSLPPHELTHKRRNLICFGIKREVSSVDNVNLSVRYVPAIGFRLRNVERRVILTPNHQQPRLPFAHPCLPFGVGVDVRAVVVEEVTLNIYLARLAKKGKFIGPKIRVIALDVRVAPYVARPRGRERQEVCAKRTLVGGAIGPKGPACLPNRSETFLVRHSVLDNERLDSLRMNQDHAKTHGAAVILHVKRVAREPKSFREVIHDFGDVIERVRELFRVWPVAVSEAGIIRRDKVIAIGKLGEETLKHPRGRRESVQQEKRWRVFRTGLSVKDGESIYLYRAINSRVFQGAFLSLRMGRRLKYCEHQRNHQHHTRNLQESGPTGKVERAHKRLRVKSPVPLGG